jgi:phosphoglycerate dehydrogenase-like enzyme
MDVYEGELDGRPPRRELVELPQVLLTPHTSGAGDASGRKRAKDLFAENLRRFLDGGTLINVVDRERGY